MTKAGRTTSKSVCTSKSERLEHSRAHWTELEMRKLSPALHNSHVLLAEEKDKIDGLIMMRDETARAHVPAQPNHLSLIPTVQSLKMQTAHLPPIGSMARKAFVEFMNRKCPHSYGRGVVTWNAVREQAIESMYVVLFKWVHGQVHSSQCLHCPTKGAANIVGHYMNMHQNLLATILYCFATGTFNAPLKNLHTLFKMRDGLIKGIYMDSNQQQEAFYNFVCPLLCQAITYMNPRQSLGYMKVCRKSIKTSIEDVRAKINSYGIWVEKRVVLRIHYEHHLMGDSHALCKGVEYAFYKAWKKFGEDHFMYELNPIEGYLTQYDAKFAEYDIIENGVIIGCMVSGRHF
jgi:hypothetical protein